uniref:Zinc knuckle CX2CX4HX4C domain-containing protein n=1 Tax=Cannabis sativa TaxID=3483 RepID=A0A803NPT3_CANSA
MASGSSSHPPIDMEEEVTLDIEEFSGLSLEVEEEEEQYDVRWCLVDRFLNVGIIDFYHELNIKRVINGSPWTFERKQLIFERLKAGDNLRTITLNRLDLRIQVYDFQHGFRTERTLQKIGDYIGKFVESDESNFSGVWREYFKVRAMINLDQPLKRRMKIHRMNSSNKFWDNFKYEHALTFCFICGLIGHADKLCPRIFQTPEKMIFKPYGAFMRATTQRQNKMIGSQWLRSGRKDKQGEAQSFSTRMHGGETTEDDLIGVQVHNAVDNVKNRGKGVDCGIQEPMIVQKFGPNFEENIGTNVEINMLNHSSGDSHDTVEDGLTISKLKKKRLNSVGPGSMGLNLNGIFENEEEVFQKKPKFVFLCETLCGKNVLERVHLSFGYEGLFVVEARGHSGGLAMLWKDSEEEEVINFSEKHINILTQVPGMPRWRLVEIYGEANRGYRANTWTHIRSLAENRSRSARKCQNMIHKLQDDDGVWLDWDTGLADHMNYLPLSTEEVRTALFQMHSDKSMGPDGMTPSFFQKCWDIVGSDVVKLVQQLFSSASLPIDLYNTLVLIPKKKNPKSMSDLRPIALFNVVYKIILKSWQIDLSKNTPLDVRGRVCSILGMVEAGDDGFYLGLPNIMKHNKNVVLSFLKDKMRKRVEN